MKHVQQILCLDCDDILTNVLAATELIAAAARAVAKLVVQTAVLSVLNGM
jgi:hypothetical protein